MPARRHKLARPHRTAKRFFVCAGSYLIFERAGASYSQMRVLPLFFISSACLIISVHADLTIVQRVEGGAQNGDVTVKIKGDKERMDAASQPTRIIDGKAGEMLDLMNDKKTFIRISATQMKAAAETMQKLDSSKPDTSKPKLRPTGKKDTISGYETEE